MDDIVLRALIVALVAFVVVGAVVVMRRRSQRSTHARRRVNLDPGVYFFSSVACAECEPARNRLAARGSKFVEYTWEQDAAVFADLQIGGVPATMVVHDDQSALVRFGPVDDSFPL
jgi:hypothetical protein